MPRDVVTRWNSTYDMLSFTLRYRKAIDTVTADKGLKLRKFELDEDDWIIVDDLVYLLEVPVIPSLNYRLQTNGCAIAIQAGHHILLSR